ncbi:MAG: rhamnulokinase [Clostridiales bacterium]|nr:rhamnulokinase [Clostridiales bacterium]
MNKAYIAFDLGASSGRLMLGIDKEGKIELEEVHRFPNDPVVMNGTMYWDIPRLFHEMKQGLKKVALRKDVSIQSMGIDTWGVDGAWLDENGQMINLPIHYRDGRTAKVIDEVESIISEETLYGITGVQKAAFNTIYQLYYDKKYNSIIKNYGKKWLFTPDLLGYLFTGKMYNEATIASTSGLIDVETKGYSKEIFDKLDLDRNVMCELVPPGTQVGTLTKAIQEETGLGSIPVIAVGSHDTASAVVGAEIEKEDEMYLVCGTWCLMGLEVSKAQLEEKARLSGFTNEGSAKGKVRLLKNINGLWILQQLKKCLNDKGLKVDFPDIIEEARKVNHEYAIDIADERFMAPINMEQEIIAACKEKYNVQLESIGEVATAVYNGLGKLYQETVQQFEELIGEEISTIRMVGGGTKDAHLCEVVKQATHKAVIKGTTEASAMGNVLVQKNTLRL